jgi:hypothetical protein
MSNHMIQRLASQHLADLRREAESERIRRRNRDQQRRARRQAARGLRLDNVKSAPRQQRGLGWLGGHHQAGDQR